MLYSGILGAAGLALLLPAFEWRVLADHGLAVKPLARMTAMPAA